MTGIVNDLTSTFEIVRRLCGDKWKFLIICYLFNGPKRYGELQYHLDSIKPKVLTENLKELEDLGIIQRTSLVVWYSEAFPDIWDIRLWNGYRRKR